MNDVFPYSLVEVLACHTWNIMATYLQVFLAIFLRYSDYLFEKKKHNDSFMLIHYM